MEWESNSNVSETLFYLTSAGRERVLFIPKVHIQNHHKVESKSGGKESHLNVCNDGKYPGRRFIPHDGERKAAERIKSFFPRAKPFIDFSALPPTPVFSRSSATLGLTQSIHNHHPNVQLRFIWWQVLESLVYGVSWLQIVCKMFCREKSLALDCFRPETSKKCLVIVDICSGKRSSRACKFYSISFLYQLYIKTSQLWRKTKQSFGLA